MDLHRYARAIRRSWWVIVVLAIVGGVGGYVYSKRQTPVYAGHLTFYVASPQLNSQDANSTNQFAQDRATSYASLAGSDALARRIIASTPGLGLTERNLANEITGSAQLNTILFDVTIKDTSPQRALRIGRSVGKQFPRLVNDLDNTGAPAGTAAVKLTVVSGPRVASAPVLPRTKLNTIIGFALGLLLGLALAVLRELLDVSVRSAEGLAEVSGLPTLGAIAYDPEIKEKPLVIGAAAHSPRAEAMRQLRTNLQFMDATRPVRTLVVTSSSNGEGKSTVSVNLALAMAETGRRVLLIEGDMRKPRVSQLLGLERAVGLSNVLAGQNLLGDVLQQWGDSTLSLLPSGPVPPNPSELLGGKRMVEVLANCADVFDMVIIDTPPLRPVTDAAVVAAEADGAIVVFWHGHTKRGVLRAALRSLDAVNARVLGCALNMKPLTRSERRGYTAYEPELAANRRPARKDVPMAAGSAVVVAPEEPLTGPIRLAPPDIADGNAAEHANGHAPARRGRAQDAEAPPG